MINYIIQVILFQVLFLVVYDFFLSKETFFSKNRWYLLSTSIVSFLLPLIKISTLEKAVPVEYAILLPEVVLSPQKVIEQTSWYKPIDYIDVLFWFVSAIFAVFFLIKLKKIIHLILKNRLIEEEDYTLVLLPKETKAFSFFNYIFLGEKISEAQREKIIQHELVHSKQKHSLDLLLFEILKIVMWFNPMIYLYQKRITLVHEYISDAEITRDYSTKTYINHILSDLFQVESISFINQFYKHSLIKKRIIMMTKQKSKTIKQFKYLLLIPLLGIMLFYSSCSELKAQDNKKRVVQVAQKNVPFSQLEKVPGFPGCEGNNHEMKMCFNKRLTKHFVTNFNSDLPNQLGLESGKKRMIMMFVIGKQGEIKDINVKAPHEKLITEAERIIKLLPKMTPGENDGKVVGVKYTLPIAIEVK